ncbi:SCP2 sterol-binding domain-containing protein [Micromonospora sp. NPDC051141]|uniref:SCP2 sterol-binding domain-containing protein n=1 Tax=Micromonospora sp. NPDC051141 TaxID=3364284 RepID=UPI0037A48539
MRRTRVAFFQALPAMAPSRLPARHGGVIRIDLAGDGDQERWYVEFSVGRARADQDDGERTAQVTITTTFSLFDALIRGEASVIGGSYRKDFGIAGQTPLYHLLRRFFDSSRSARDPRIRAQECRRHGLLWRESLEADLRRHAMRRAGSG